MDWQLGVVGLIVAVSGWYLARQTWRSWTGNKSGCAGCSCHRPASTTTEGPPATFIPSDQIGLRH